MNARTVDKFCKGRKVIIVSEECPMHFFPNGPTTSLDDTTQFNPDYPSIIWLHPEDGTPPTLEGIWVYLIDGNYHIRTTVKGITNAIKVYKAEKILVLVGKQHDLCKYCDEYTSTLFDHEVKIYPFEGAYSDIDPANYDIVIQEDSLGDIAILDINPNLLPEEK